MIKMEKLNFIKNLQELSEHYKINNLVGHGIIIERL